MWYNYYMVYIPRVEQFLSGCCTQIAKVQLERRNLPDNDDHCGLVTESDKIARERNVRRKEGKINLTNFWGTIW